VSGILRRPDRGFGPALEIGNSRKNCFYNKISFGYPDAAEFLILVVVCNKGRYELSIWD